MKALSTELTNRYDAEVARILKIRQASQRIITLLGQDLVQKVRAAEHKIKVHNQATLIMNLLKKDLKLKVKNEKKRRE